MPVQPVQIVYDGQHFYELDTEKQIFYRQFLRLLCPKNCDGGINICVISEDICDALKKFGSLLVEFKKRDTPFQNHVKKYKVIAFSEIEYFQKSSFSKEVHIIFHWLNPH